MGSRSGTLNRFFSITVCAVYAALFALGTSANPVPADEQSLTSGADLFGFHCTQCHGWDPADEHAGLYAVDPADEDIDFTELIDIDQDSQGPAEEEWPEWAELPDPGEKAYNAREREAILAELTGAIDNAYGTGEDSLERAFDDAELEFEAAGLTPQYMDKAYPGATDLTQPQAYYYGVSDFDLYEIISRGTDNGMPAFSVELGSDEAIWDLINYIRSLWGEEWVD